MQLSIRRTERGFTLIEVLVAICVFALGILALTRVQMGAVTANSFANELTQATSLAQQHMDTILGLPISYAGAGDYQNCWVDTNNNGGANQDTNLNGIDGDDESVAVDGIGSFGLDRIDAQADHTLPAPIVTPYGTFTISWNIAINQPVRGSMTARTIVRWQDKRKTWHSLSFDCVKSSSY